LDTLLSRIPRGSISAVSFSLVLLFGIGIMVRRQEEDLSIGGTVAAVGLCCLLWQVGSHLRTQAITRKKMREMKRK
jgi:hypothetical protein